jgi:hypothetical protein
MKLVRYGAVGAERPALLDSEGGIRDLTDFIPDVAGPALLPDSLRTIRQLNPSDLPLVAGRRRLGMRISSLCRSMPRSNRDYPRH